MILYIVTQTLEQYQRMSVHTATRERLETLADDYCTLLHYRQVSLPLLAELRPWAICHSGGRHGGALYADGFRRCVTEWDTAQIGFCAGHQLSARMFGSTVGPMRPLRPDEPDPDPKRVPGFFKATGFSPVEVTRQDPLFAGLPATLLVWQNHGHHITTLGPDLIPLARSENCPVEAWVHRSKPIYGVQFHPEVHDPEHPHGSALLGNFFHIARAHQEQQASQTHSA